jgi:hypothetical protein
MRNTLKGGIITGVILGVLIGLIVLSFIWGGSLILVFAIGAVAGGAIGYYYGVFMERRKRV